MEVISRQSLFTSDLQEDSPALDLDLQLQEVQVSADQPLDGPEDGFEGFCLFGGETITASEFNAPEEPEQDWNVRPSSYYFYKYTESSREKCQNTAIYGQDAAHWIDSRETTAPDINAHYKPQKRRCRPGSATRRARKDRHLQIKAEKQAELRRQRMKRKAKGPRR